MKKIIYLVFIVLLGFPCLGLAVGEKVSVDYYYVASPDYFYPSTFDNLVLDFAITPETTDTLQDLVVKNEGSA